MCVWGGGGNRVVTKIFVSQILQNFCENVSFYFREFCEILNNFVKISCFANFLKRHRFMAIRGGAGNPSPHTLIAVSSGGGG